ncbi:cysteine proteinase [Jaminaea rosea]|uniref:Ubiquitin carboxyl-terminal hydrolase n=1 Tax=Jaminaea rosea TaxID=1569628 RepID=A0A316UNB6_9BASI|nr:cysteine proteinase [Jaminaea rosea]PWN26444.1 cysteine proteinase [Jaminaea rosea]
MPALVAGKPHRVPLGPDSSSPPHPSSSSSKSKLPSIDSALQVQSVLSELLSNPLKFEKSKLQPPKVKYPPINEGIAKSPHMTVDYDEPMRNSASSSSSSSPASASALASSSKSMLSSPSAPSLYSGRIPLTWPREARNVGAGLHNRGNTCYMNSTMQAIVHTAPLAHLLLTQDVQLLKGKLGGSVKNFDPVKALQSFTQRAIGKTGGRTTTTTPEEFIRNLKSVAKSFHHGRQEDAHEWLRLLLDSLQQACLAEGSAKAKQSALRETTFVHQIFGGRLRSRVTCGRCKHHSDTFDPILDLSLDIRRCDSVQDAFHLFTDVEQLRGSEKYRCEKCKNLVNAEKHFKIDQAPNVLTVHLKRFTFTGAKIGRPIEFQEKLRLKGRWMSSGQDGPSYSLYAVVHHHGGGPHSGHYVAQVKSPAGKWCGMNDDMVSPSSRPGAASKSAYILFYVREGGNGDSLAQAISTATTSTAPVHTKSAKRPPSDLDEEDLGARSTAKHPHLSTASSPPHSKVDLSNSSSSSSSSNNSSFIKHPKAHQNGRPASSPLGTSIRSPYAASYGGNVTPNGSSPPSSRFSLSKAANKHGADFLHRIGGGKHKKHKSGGAGAGILSPISAQRFHTHGGGGQGSKAKERMKGRKSI